MSGKSYSVLAVIFGIGIITAAIVFPSNNEIELRDPQNFEWKERVEVASGDAQMGQWRMNDSDFNLIDAPSVSLTDDGVAAVVWADQSEQEIFIQIFESSGENRFDEPVNVSNNPGIFSWLPRVVITNDAEQVFVLWQEIVFSGGSHGGEIFFTKSADGGETFTDSINLSNTESGAGKGRFTHQRWFNGSLDLAVSENGDIFAAWTEYEGPLWFARSTDGGESFSDPLHIDGDDQTPARAPSIATGSNGELFVSWSVGEGHQSDIRFSYSDDSGHSFHEPQQVTNNNFHDDAPRIVIGKNGTVHLVYSESTGGLWRDYQILHTSLNNDTGIFNDPVVISDFENEQIRSSAFPSIKVDGQDNIYVLWYLFTDAGQRPRGLGITYSDEGGESFKTPEVVPGSMDQGTGETGGRQGLFMDKLDVNSNGEISVVSSTFNEGESSHIWLIRGVAVHE